MRRYHKITLFFINFFVFCSFTSAAVTLPYISSNDKIAAANLPYIKKTNVESNYSCVSSANITCGLIGGKYIYTYNGSIGSGSGSNYSCVGSSNITCDLVGGSYVYSYNGSVGSVGGGGDGTGGWINTTTDTYTNLKVNVSNNVQVGELESSLFPDYVPTSDDCADDITFLLIGDGYQMNEYGNIETDDSYPTVQIYDTTDSGAPPTCWMLNDCYDSYNNVTLYYPTSTTRGTDAGDTRQLDSGSGSAESWIIYGSYGYDYEIYVEFEKVGQKCKKHLTLPYYNSTASTTFRSNNNKWKWFAHDKSSSLALFSEKTNNTVIWFNGTTAFIPYLEITTALTIPILTVTEQLNVFKISTDSYLNMTINNENVFRMTGNKSIALGQGAFANESVLGCNAIGVNSSCQANYCTAIGYNTTCNESYTTKFGSSSVVIENEAGNIRASGNITAEGIICDSVGCIGSGGGGNVNGTDIAPRSIWGPSSSEAVRIGQITDCSWATTNDDLCVDDILEVDGDAYFNGGGAAYFSKAGGYGNIIIKDNSFNNWALASLDDDGGRIGLEANDGRGNHNLIITSYNNMDRDHDHDTLSVNPKLWIHSATNPDTDNTQWLGLRHNQTDGVIDTGKGDLVLNPTGNVSVVGNSISNVDCVYFKSGGKICTG